MKPKPTRPPGTPVPGFDGYYFDHPIKNLGPEDKARLANDQPPGFLATLLPKLGVPVPRGFFRGIYNYYGYEPRSGFLTVYDGDSTKPTYDSNQGLSLHTSTDFGVSYLNFGFNELVNPFPQGAVVRVTGVQKGVPDGSLTPSAGNYVYLTCYLDGNPANGERSNLYVCEMLHLQQDKVFVEIGDDVAYGQVLGMIGYSGNTSLEGSHVHMNLRYTSGTLDPFYGRYNTTVGESLFFDQAFVERIANFRATNNSSPWPFHLMVNSRFYLDYREGTTYEFTADREFARLFCAPVDQQQPEFEIPFERDQAFQTTVQVEGKNHTRYGIRFKPLPLPADLGEYAFEAEDQRGLRSNRVWLTRS